MQKYQQLIAHQLETIELKGSPVELYEPLRYVLSLGGKRMRPVLVLTGCGLFGGEVKAALPAAIAVELFHNFTLVHDDIMDQAPLRRNQPTVHQKWNVNIAILGGDALMVKAYEQLSRTSPDKLPEVLEVFNRAAIQVCEGQQLDMNYEGQIGISISQYLEMIGLKTAVLLAASLQIGAIIGGATTKDAQRMYDFGKNLGMAFQLQDDLLDVYGDQGKFGKQKGGDILLNKKTFLLLMAMEMSETDTSKKENLLNWMKAPASEAKVEAVTRIYNELGIPLLVEEKMKIYYKAALASLAEIPLDENKSKEMIEFIDSLMARES